MELKFILTFLTLGLASGFEFVIQPKSITALKGESVMLACSVRNTGRGNIYWQRVNTGRYVSQDYFIDPYDVFGNDVQQRYRIIGEPEAGEYTLLINDVRKSDIGRYACIYSEPAGAKVVSRHATLSVLIPPGPEFPRCRTEPANAVVGDTIALICESDGGLPPATLTWLRGNDILKGNYGKAGSLTENRFTKVLEATDRGVEFVCEASGIAIIGSVRTCSITPLGFDILVQTKPKVKVAKEGSRATFTCVAPGDMTNYDVYWLIGDEELHFEDPRMSFRDGHPRLRIDPVTMSDHGKLITCVVYDFYGFQGNASSALFVSKTEITQEPSKNAIVFEMEPVSEVPTKISMVASVEGVQNGRVNTVNELPAADQATVGDPNNGAAVDPSGSTKVVSEQMKTKQTEAPLLPNPTPSVGSNNPSMIFTNHFTMPTIDGNSNKTINRGDIPSENILPTKGMNATKDETSMNKTMEPNNVVDTTTEGPGDIVTETNEVEVPEMQSEANGDGGELDTNNVDKEGTTDKPETPNEIVNGETNNEGDKNNLEGDGNTENNAKDKEENKTSGMAKRIKIICSVLGVGVILIGFGFWRFSKSR